MSDEKYKKYFIEHPVYGTIQYFIEFYADLSFNMLMKRNSELKLELDGIFFDYFESTINSMKELLENGHINDIYALLRKFYDMIIVQIYLLIYIENNKFKNRELIKKIDNWIKGKERLPESNFKNMSLYISEYEYSKEIWKEFKKDHIYKKIRENCNDYVHLNYFKNILLNMNYPFDIEVYKEKLDDLNEYLIQLSILHMSYIILIKGHYVMGSDYMDYLSCGKEPPENSQYWIAPFFEDYFNGYIMKFKPDVGELLRKRSYMKL